jgi:hypothetical protein
MITEYFGNNLLVYPENKKEYDKIVLFIKKNNILLRLGINDIYSSILHNKTYFIINPKFEDNLEMFLMEKKNMKRYQSQLNENLYDAKNATHYKFFKIFDKQNEIFRTYKDVYVTNQKIYGLWYTAIFKNTENILTGRFINRFVDGTFDINSWEEA